MFTDHDAKCDTSSKITSDSGSRRGANSKVSLNRIELSRSACRVPHLVCLFVNHTRRSEVFEKSSIPTFDKSVCHICETHSWWAVSLRILTSHFHIVIPQEKANTRLFVHLYHIRVHPLSPSTFICMPRCCLLRRVLASFVCARDWTTHFSNTSAAYACNVFHHLTYVCVHTRTFTVRSDARGLKCHPVDVGALLNGSPVLSMKNTFIWPFSTSIVRSLITRSSTDSFYMLRILIFSESCLFL